MYICGNYEDIQTGETASNVLYVTFYSDHSIQNRGFNMSYVQLEGMVFVVMSYAYF